MDTPTAGTLPRGAFDMELKTFPGGGIRSTLSIGLNSRFSAGIGYGASYVLADVEPEWNSEIEFLLKIRLHEESDEFPAIAIGFCSIGNGPYDDEYNRYAVKSPGFYLAFSKNFGFYNNPAAWHWGINYSLETDYDDDPSVFVGFNADLGPNMTFLSEYDFAFNDNHRYDIYGKKRGYLNIGLAWYITDELSLELDLKNLLQNRDDAESIDREARLVYVEYFY
jgi:hypothetical protein